MSTAKKRGPGPSHLLLTPDHAGNVVGIDPHKRTLTATVVDPRGGVLASEHFRVSGDGHRALEAWARQFGQIARWGIEGSASWGRRTAVYLTGRGYDVRDVCANRTPRSDRARQRGKSDTLDSERIAREVLAHSLLPRAFERAGQEQVHQGRVRALQRHRPVARLDRGGSRRAGPPPLQPRRQPALSSALTQRLPAAVLSRQPRSCALTTNPRTSKEPSRGRDVTLARETAGR